jgi:hypothetical protein
MQLADQFIMKCFFVLWLAVVFWSYKPMKARNFWEKLNYPANGGTINTLAFNMGFTELLQRRAKPKGANNADISQ